MVINGEVWVKNMYIAEYSYGSYNNHTTHRDRKLLLNRKEIRRIAKENMQPGVSIVPLRLFINERGLAKLVIAMSSLMPNLRLSLISLYSGLSGLNE